MSDVRFAALLPHGGGRQIPKRIVVHVMGEYIRYQGRVFTARELLDHERLSAHALITPSGVNIRCREDNQVAYHAKGHNLGSLGIEFLAKGVHTLETLQELTKTDYLTHDQYWEGVTQVREWIQMHGIRNIDRHSDLDIDRRWYDPGVGFPWQLFLNDVGTGKNG